MAQGARPTSYMGITAGYVFIALAISILLAVAMNRWILFIPLTLILVGIYGLFIGFMARSRGPITGFGGLSDAAYFIFWSSILAIIGISWLVNDAYPGATLYIILAFLIWFGFTLIVISISRPHRVKQS